MKAYKRKEHEFNPHYPDDFDKIKTFLEENGTINATDEKLQALYYIFSNKYAYLSEDHSAWLPPTDEILDMFATYLENEDISGKELSILLVCFNRQCRNPWRLNYRKAHTPLTDSTRKYNKKEFPLQENIKEDNFMKNSYFVSRLNEISKREMRKESEIRMHHRFGTPISQLVLDGDRIVLMEDTPSDKSVLTVDKLIPFLSEMDPNAIVTDQEYNPVFFVNAAVGDNDFIWLETENDLDMKSALTGWFEHAAEAHLDETDFYSELLDIGITVDLLRKYLGEEAAVHMDTFCREHGLM